ncbi:helix-turn-helix domain-containing protein [Streptomyces sp. NPDC048650]|uniref:helix-turn-helix domain-containing protein n=1 Tax=unclassified Streptomyces TaxID=2593676 RepID=UPI0037131B03
MGEERDPGGPHGAPAYRERGSRLPGAVLWTTTVLPSVRPVLPDGCMDLIWTEGRLLVAGPDTGPHHPAAAGAPPGARFTGLRFAPGQGPDVLGVPAHELRNLRVPLEELWPAGRVRELAGRVAAEGAAALEEAAGARLSPAAPGRSRIAAVAAALARGRPVAEVARAAELGERRLYRLSLDAFGYGPKTLTRVLRFVRAMDLARAGVPYAEAAARAGYADQAHLAREVKSLAGAPMGVLLASG